MKLWLVLGGAAAIGLSGCAVDPYTTGTTAPYGQYGNSGYGQSYGTGVDASATATYGEVYLDSGFDEDPYRVSVTSGGSIDASEIASGCTGMVARAPDFQLTYDAGGLPLTFGVNGEVDTTLVINGPDGRWTCDDDSGGGTDPEITYSRPQSGTYDVWVGAFGGDSGSAELFVTELGSDYGRSNNYGDNDSYDRGNGRRDDDRRNDFYDNDNRNNGRNADYGSTYPDSSATAAYGEIDLSSGFRGDPYTVSVLAGGSIDASTVDDSCAGRIASAPDFQITYDAGSLPLTIGATSNGDVTLVVNGPDGQWYCDDDSGGSNDAELTFRRPQSGVYDIWVGSYGGDSLPAELFFTELR
ncbi:peptidase [Brevundimonas subvibrioides]|uniref:peptidase n=1 Tax=Brevundimonas subvibrioides TaxID=74313 RepID=UPI0022B41924|nr:peptidase [Brevundimonas subvibrioides]